MARSAAVLALAAFPIAGTVRAAVPDDLQLGEINEPWRRTEPKPNPHGSIPCGQCHTKSQASYEVALQFGILMPLVTEGESSILLCEKCHKDAHSFHPVNIRVQRLAEAVARAGCFPLEMPIEGYYKLTCTSCHAVHFPHAANRLLRGFAVAPAAGGSIRTRLDFCRSCHGAEEILALSGHRALVGDVGCGLCHGTRTDPEVIGALRKSLNRTCGVCHPPAPGEPAHYAEYNPFPGLAPEALQAADVERLQGRFTCATCHRHHRPTPSTPFLKAGFVSAVAKAYLVNPHRTTRFCLNCHTGNPPPPGTTGAAAPLVEADVTRLCQGCHERDGALRMHHPLAAPTAAAAVPAEWPLRKDGTLGCETCHLAGHGPPDRANPQFLRGGASPSRNGVCLRCHLDVAVQGRNIHAEVSASRGCDFCHERAEPTPDAEKEKPGPIRAEPTLLCLRCHGVAPHPASAVHTVRPRPTSFLKIDESCAPLALGKVTCHTCHDSHAALGENRLLRLTGQSFCSNCHPF